MEVHHCISIQNSNLTFLQHFLRKVLESKLFIVYLHIPTNKGNKYGQEYKFKGKSFGYGGW